MFLLRYACIAIAISICINTFVDGVPRRILVDTDVDTDDLSAILYLLKLNTSEFDLQAITINANSWTDAGHAVNQVYDILYMMGRDDISVGVGGEGGILEDGTIHPNVGGYHPIIEQGISTAAYCRYRQAIPVGLGGRLNTDANLGFRKSFLPQGKRKYTPLKQPSVQQVMIEKLSSGSPVTIFTMGAQTNLALFLMSNPNLKKNIEHIYISGGGVRSKNSTFMGNVFTEYTSNPYAEFNFLVDPFAAYQVIHSGIPVTLVPLDATNTIPITSEFFEVFEQNLHTYEAQYVFNSLKLARDTWFDDQSFYRSYFMWDSFMSGVATSIMRKKDNHEGENEFAEMEFMNITVVTSNIPYGVSDGSNPLFDGLKFPKFNLTRNGVHSGHVQTGLRDPFCLVNNGKGRCQDGRTVEVTGEEAVRVLVAVKAKENPGVLNRKYFTNFLDVLNQPQQSGRFNFTTQFPYYKEVVYKPDLVGKKLGKNVVFDMDMSAGDFISLIYLLKQPLEIINLKGILVTPTGWANAATIDIVYDVLHMMGRDDIYVGLGDVFATNQSDPNNSVVGDCKYNKAIPHGSGGFIDSDTLYGHARNLPRSPRRYTAENSVKFGAPRDTDHPELRQPLAMEIWELIVQSLNPGEKVTILANGPLTNIAKITLSGELTTSRIQEIIIVGGHIRRSNHSKRGNVINVPSNRYAELNMFLDPLAAKTVFDSQLNITLIPLAIQRKVNNFHTILESLGKTNKTPEAVFTRRLLSTLHRLQKHHKYQHMDIFLKEILGAVILGSDHSILKPIFKVRPVKVYATGNVSEDGQLAFDGKKGKQVNVLQDLDHTVYYNHLAHSLGDKKQSAVLGSFDEQRRIWNTPSDG